MDLALNHGRTSQIRHIPTMVPVIFTCPATSMNVQQWLVDEPNARDDEYEVITCPACAGLHLLNRKTGKLLRQDDE